MRHALNSPDEVARWELRKVRRDEDDGVGFAAPPAGTAGRSLGLFHVRERIERMGGRFEIGQASRARGTRAVLELPIDRRPEPDGPAGRPSP